MPETIIECSTTYFQRKRGKEAAIPERCVRLYPAAPAWANLQIWSYTPKRTRTCTASLKEEHLRELRAAIDKALDHLAGRGRSCEGREDGT